MLKQVKNAFTQKKLCHVFICILKQDYANFKVETRSSVDTQPQGYITLNTQQLVHVYDVGFK